MPGLQQQQQAPITVEQLVQLNPYNPDILPDLESYVQEQVSHILLSPNSLLKLASRIDRKAL
jgi:hypothetical protein